jgi:arginase
MTDQQLTAHAVRRELSVVGAPTSAGAYGPGQERSPAVFRQHGLVELLRSRGVVVRDRGDVSGANWQPDDANPTTRNADTVAAVIGRVAERVSQTFADDHDVLVLGGDCTVELGTVAGAVADGASVALVYVDLDADLNTPSTGDGVLDWMGVAHMLAVEGTDERLTHLAVTYPMLPADAVMLMAVDNITPPEQAVIDALQLRVERLAIVRDDPEAAAARAVEWARGFDRLLVHVDIDVLDVQKFPIAENTDVRGGLELAELARLLVGLCAAPNWRGLTLTEVNPAHAPDEALAVFALMAVLADALAQDGVGAMGTG